MTFFHRLGGWLRLWVVVAAVYGLIVIAFGIITVPSRREVFHAWTNDLFSTLEEDAKRTAGKDISAAAFRRTKTFQNMTEEQIAYDLTRRVHNIDSADPAKVDQIPFKETVTALAEKYEKRLSTLPLEYVKHAGICILAWLLPSFGVLCLGYAITWVIQGFRNHEADHPIEDTKYD